MTLSGRNILVDRPHLTIIYWVAHVCIISASQGLARVSLISGL